MKLSEIYRNAAKLIERNKTAFACFAIDDACRGNRLLAKEPQLEFSGLFRPIGKGANESWFRDAGSTPDERRNIRILALCFMVAIAESEGK